MGMRDNGGGLLLQAVLPVLPSHQECVSLPPGLLCTPGSLPPAGAVPDERLQCL